jgi:hypothetical protein
LIDLIDSIKPGCINYDLVKSPDTEEVCNVEKNDFKGFNLLGIYLPPPRTKMAAVAICGKCISFAG